MTDWWADAGAAPQPQRQPATVARRTASTDWWADLGEPQNVAIEPEPMPSPASLDPTEQAPPVSTTADVVKSAGAGLVRGGIGLAALPGTIESLGRKGLNMAGAGVSEETAMPTYGDIAPRVEAVTGRLYKPQTTAGEYARTIGEFAPGALFPGGIAQRVVGNVLAPALGSEAAGQLTEGTSAEPYARVAGALAGAIAPGMAARAVSPVKGGGTERAKFVKTLENEGVTTLTAGQKTGSKPLRWTESTIGDMPFTGGRAASLMEQQGEQFTRAALKRAGVDANRATPDVMNDAFVRIGRDFDAIAANAKVPPSVKLYRDSKKIVDDYKAITPQGMRAEIVENLFNDIQRAVRPFGKNPRAGLTGKEYVSWRSQIDRAARGAAGNPPLADALRGLRNTLDDAVERGLPQNLTDKWRKARTEYRNILAIERAAVGAGEAAAEGIISPSALRNAVKTIHGTRNYARGKGDLADLARAGEAIMKPLPQSGTAPRAAFQNMLQIVGAGAGGTAGGFPGAVAGAALPALAGRAIMSKPAQTYLANQTAMPVRNAMMSGQSVRASLPGLNVGNSPPPPPDVIDDPVMRSMWASPQFQAFLNRANQ